MHLKPELLMKYFVRAIVLVVAMCRVAVSEIPDSQIRSAAETFITQVQGAVRPPNWDNASIQEIDPVSTPKGQWYLCKLTGTGGPAGYVLIAQVGDQLRPAMYSGSAFPTNLPTELAVQASAQSLPRAAECPKDVPMIGLFQSQDPPGTIRTTSPATCVASVLIWMQKQRQYPLFYRIAVGGAHFEEDAARCFSLGSSGRSAPGALGPPTASHPGQQEDAQRALASYRSRKLQLLSENNLLQKTDTAPTEPRQGGRITDYVRAFSVLSPLRKNELASPVTAWHRFEVIRDEHEEADLVLYQEKSPGMVCAYLLEHAYLKPAGSLDHGIEAFFLSRGFHVSVERKPTQDLNGRDLPCVILSSQGTALLLVALASPGDAPSEWALVSVPGTVESKREKLADRLRAGRVQRGLPPDPPERIDTSLPEDAQAKVREKLARLKALNERLVIVEDPPATPPESLAMGAHWVRLAALSGWQAITISDPVLADNWGDQKPVLRGTRKP